MKICRIWVEEINSHLNQINFKIDRKFSGRFFYKTKYQSVSSLIAEEKLILPSLHLQKSFLTFVEQKTKRVKLFLLLLIVTASSLVSAQSRKCEVMEFTGNVLAIEIEFRNEIPQPMDDPEKFKQEFAKAEALSNSLGMDLWIVNEITNLHHGTLQLTAKEKIFSATIALPKN